MEVTIYSLTYRGQPGGPLHVSFEPHDPNSTLTVGRSEAAVTYFADTSISWPVATPGDAILERDEIGRLVLVWNCDGQRQQAGANEVLVFAQHGLRGFRCTSQPR